MSIENEDERKEDFERRRKEEATINLLAQLQQKQDDEAAMLLGNIKHKVCVMSADTILNFRKCLGMFKKKLTGCSGDK